MEYELEDIIQFQNDLFVALTAALHEKGVLPREELADYLQAIAEKSTEAKKTYLRSAAQNVRLPGSHALKISVKRQLG